MTPPRFALSALSLAAVALGAAPDPVASGKALAALQDWLADPAHKTGLPDADAPFAAVALTRADAGKAADALDARRIADLRRRAEADMRAKAVAIGDKTMRFDMLVFGPKEKPAKGRSLFISMHGGGNAPASLNDSQWKNQLRLGMKYAPAEGLYLAPRAPTDSWNLWHEAHIDAMFDRIIADLVALGEVNPDRVYLMGYSAGGDGVYQLAPRMSDRWAAAAMMAGHPNETSPLGFRNVPTAFQVGERDGAYNRNKICAQWGVKLDALRAADPEGYAHLVDLPKGKPHWMDLEDRKAVPWMEKFTRDPLPKKIVWVQDDVIHPDFYWLAVNAAETRAGRMITARIAGSHVTVDAKDSGTVFVRLSDKMTDLDAPVTLERDGGKPVEVTVVRTIATLAKTLSARGDRELMFPAEVELKPAAAK